MGESLCMCEILGSILCDHSAPSSAVDPELFIPDPTQETFWIRIKFFSKNIFYNFLLLLLLNRGDIFFIKLRCHPPDSAVSQDAGIDPRTDCCDFGIGKSDALTTRLGHVNLYKSCLFNIRSSLAGKLLSNSKVSSIV